jgi:hypothetical protein
VKLNIKTVILRTIDFSTWCKYRLLQTCSPNVFTCSPCLYFPYRSRVLKSAPKNYKVPPAQTSCPFPTVISRRRFCLYLFRTIRLVVILQPRRQGGQNVLKVSTDACQVRHIGTHSITKVNQRWAQIVLGWVTTQMTRTPGAVRRCCIYWYPFDHRSQALLGKK